jgi:hypothetical protein
MMTVGKQDQEVSAVQNNAFSEDEARERLCRFENVMVVKARSIPSGKNNSRRLLSRLDFPFVFVAYVKKFEIHINNSVL